MTAVSYQNGEDISLNTRPKAKHIQLAEWLRERIQNGTYAPGEKIPSENELAASFQFSRQTVRQAIGKLESEGLLSRSQGSGTYVSPAFSAESAQKTMRIGVITTYLDDYVFPGIIHGIEKVLTEKGYTMFLGITHNKQADEENCLRQMLSNGVDGIIVEGTKSALPNINEELYDSFIKLHVPLVFINGYYGSRNDSWVVMDDVKAGALLAGVLAQNGHRKIAGIFKSDDMQGVKRYQGVCSGAKALGLELNDNSVLWYTTEDLPFYFEPNFDPVILERLKGCTAAVCYNDQIAASLLKVLSRNQKRVPEDLSLVSFDNSFLAAQMACNLTSVTYPAQEIGRQAALLLLKKLERPDYNEQIKLEPVIVSRGSVKNIAEPADF